MSDQLTPDPTSAAVSLFWTKRADQMAALADGGASGGGARAGGHMNGVRDLVASIFIESGMPKDAIVKEPYLPGYYRVRKKWDLAIRYKGALVAALEFKSQVGSVGKNINNRFEEALGTGTDTNAAQRKLEAFGDVPPWLGYVFVLREDSETEQSRHDTSALFPTDPTFHGLSYNQRYQEMIRRFMGDNVYQLGWFITTCVDGQGVVSYNEPLATATGKAFRAAVQGRVNYVLEVLG
ncbi:PaeR7I family type II restriction endonuclease [Micromonospora sp. NBC_01813]|uniref:PaeR7I family type II restriction endonuclease n=1 Tax=Micromonospora sp. NBC_01813 TaxID=2975988 RepID=UPI002DDA96E4|nr:PaeR7I family type II restriction endonuclease [Micromonospora sp. NBC_01813]WSA09003.1 PaeR7I family type II restriction endonuclease [Micromonospora sp. NBC_01813]